MTLKEREKIDNLFYVNNIDDKKKEKEEKKRIKEREKRIKQNKSKVKDKFDYDTETVIGMTNKNNITKKQENNIKLTKKQKKILKKKQKIKKVIKLITILALISGGIIFALVSPIFNITDIEVANNNQITTDTIISLSGLKNGDNIFKFLTSKVKKNIKENAYIENVNIKRVFPNKVKIQIAEREKSYNVEFLNGYAYINNQGYILEISEQKQDLPIIKGISTEEDKMVAGNRLNEEDLGKLEVVLQIVNICKDYNLDTKITSVDISDKNEYIMYFEEEKKTIYLGDETNLSTKMLYVQAIMEKNKEKEGYIYVNGDFNTKLKARFKEKV